MSVSVTMPIRRPPSVTGSAPILWSSMSRAASAASRSGPTVITDSVITCPTVSFVSRWLISHTERLVACEGRLRRISRSVTMPTSRPSFVTSRCRKCWLSIRQRASSIGVSGRTVMGAPVISSRTRMGASFKFRDLSSNGNQGAMLWNQSRIVGILRADDLGRHPHLPRGRRRHRHRLQASARDGGRRLLLDCGLFQGLKALRQRNWARAAARSARARRRRPEPRARRPLGLPAAARAATASRAGLLHGRHRRSARGHAAGRGASAGGRGELRQPAQDQPARSGAAALHHGGRGARAAPR